MDRRIKTMPISDQLLEILCCPKTKAAVKMLSEDELRKFNDLIAEGKLKFEDGTAVEEPLQEALITVDGATLYRIDDNIPVMLIERGIAADQAGQ